MQQLTALRVTRADRTGSSWPVLVETEAGPRFTKLRGAGQGVPALVAEIIVASLAEAIGLNVPARSLVTIPPEIESADRRDELRDLLDASVGVNLGFVFLEAATMLDPARLERVTSDEASAIMWLDALVMNPDRAARNPNLMWSGGRLWLIDHGAALGFQYSWADVSEASPSRPFAPREPHVLHTRAHDLDEWDELLAARLSRETIERAVAEVPDDFLEGDAERRRAAFVAYLWKRLKAPRDFFRHFPTVSTVRTGARRR